MKKIIINLKTIITVILVIVVLATVFVKSTAHIGTSYFLMDTYVTIDVNGFNAKKAEQSAYAALKNVESTMNSHKDTSKLNLKDYDEDLIAVLKKGIYYGDLSNGLFDITVKPLTDLWGITDNNPKVPTQQEIYKAKQNVNYKLINISGNTVSVPENITIDLGGIAKGYAADKAAYALKKYGINDGCINLGGNVYAIGKKKIGIQNPLAENGEYMGILTISDCSVATSGAYERYFEQDGKVYHHIINPFTGYPADTDLHSATVISSSSVDADSLSTILFMLGKNDAVDFAEKNNVNYILIDKNLNVYYSNNLDFKITDNNFKECLNK